MREFVIKVNLYGGQIAGWRQVAILTINATSAELAIQAAESEIQKVYDLCDVSFQVS